MGYIADYGARSRNDEKSREESKYFVRPVKRKPNKWVYNFAKLCYTKKKFLTLKARPKRLNRWKMNFHGVRIDLKQRADLQTGSAPFACDFYGSTQKIRYLLTRRQRCNCFPAYMGTLKSLFAAPASEVLLLLLAFYEKESDTLI